MRQRHPTQSGRPATSIGLAVLLAAGCGSAAEAPSTPPAGATASVVGRAPDGFGPAVVTLLPSGGGELPDPVGPTMMDQFGMAFSPTLLVASVGQPVEFRNSEDVAHNVRVAERATDAVLLNATVLLDQGIEHTFDRVGDYSVRCDIHPGMHALIIVVTSPFRATTDRDGRFRIAEVPPGRYLATVRDPGSQRVASREIEIGGAGPTDLGAQEWREDAAVEEDSPGPTAADVDTAWVPSIGSPQYFAVQVGDLDASTDWYRAVFGLREMGRSQDEAGAWAIVNLANEHLRVELIRDARSAARGRHQGFFKVGFAVANAEAIADRIAAATGERPRVVTSEREAIEIVQIRDPDGNIVQLFSPIESARAPR